MNLTFQWMDSIWFKALGWTFVHSLWQITLIGLLLFIALRLISGDKANLRYTVSTLALWLIVVSSLCTFIVMLPASKQASEFAGPVLLLIQQESTSWTQQLATWLEARMPMMLTIWIGGVFLLMTRLAFSLVWIGHMRTSSRVALNLQNTLDEITSRLHIRIKATAAESGLIKSPVTIGHLKPLILFPIGIINQLSPREVEAILTHELAHIVRRDYLSNLIQTVIETIFYYHPVTWWISRVVRSERENRADDLAVKWCGDHLSYAKALMTVEEMQMAYRPLLAIGFASRKGAMLARIQRILHIPNKNHNQMEKTVLLSLCSLCFLAFTFTDRSNDQKKESSPSPTVKEYILTISDTLPQEGIYKIHKKTDTQDISIEVENGDIKELKIDGKPIQPSAYDAYGGIIDELFGSMQSPPSPMEYDFFPPGVPAFPSLPSVEGYILPAPPMPAMDPAQLERLYRSNNIAVYGGSEAQVKILYDSLDGTHSRMLIITGKGDTSKIDFPLGAYSYGFNMEAPDANGFFGGKAYTIEVPGYKMDMKAEEMRRFSEEWKAQGKEWKRQAEQENELMQNQWKEDQKKWKTDQEQWKADQEQWKESIKIYDLESKELKELIKTQDYDQLRESLRELEGMRIKVAPEMGHLRTTEPFRRMYTSNNIGDMMTEDGLIAPGESAEIVLTPDKLKINGKKMDDRIHRKYLDMYETQQGVKLSGNSRVEFKTKSRGSM